MSLTKSFTIAVFALFAIASSAVAERFDIPVQPPVYLIHGYVDRAPAHAKVVDRVDITAPGKPTRWLLVTSYRSPSDVLLGNYLSQALKHPWSVQGEPADVSRLFAAPAGTEFDGQFVVYRGGYPFLRIAELDKPS